MRPVAGPTPFGLEAEALPMSNEGVSLSVEDLADYCRTQAGLLAGHAETIGAEAGDLLDEIDEDIAELRSRLAARGSREASAPSPPTPSADGPDDMAELERLKSDLEEKQTLAEAKRARMSAFQDLSTAYAELAADLTMNTDDGRAALDRVIQFERDHDAPVYFEDRQTVLEAAAASPE